jgi:hypothetical protein
MAEAEEEDVRFSVSRGVRHRGGDDFTIPVGVGFGTLARMTTDDNDVPRRRAPDRAELGEMVWKGHGGRRPRVLAHGGDGDKRLVLGRDHLYWSDEGDGSITRLPKDGGVPLVLATEQTRPTALVLHDGYLYWATSPGVREQSGHVVRMPEEGGDIETLAVGNWSVQSIAVEGRDVYWTDFGDGLAGGAVLRGSTSGAPPMVIASKQKQPDSIVVAGQELYWANTGNKRPSYFRDGSVMRMRRDVDRKRWVLVKNGSMPASVVAGEESVYWSIATPYDAPDELGGVFKRPRAGGKPSKLATLSQHGLLLAVDATHVYAMCGYEGAMYRILERGGEPEQILSSVDSAFESTFVGGFAADERFLYWTATYSGKAGGAIWKMAK